MTPTALNKDLTLIKIHKGLRLQLLGDNLRELRHLHRIKLEHEWRRHEDIPEDALPIFEELMAVAYGLGYIESFWRGWCVRARIVQHSSKPKRLGKASEVRFWMDEAAFLIGEKADG